MKEQVLNEIVKFDSTAEYYQQLEKSILGNQSCYEATVVDGELLGMKVLVEGKHPVGLYLPNATDERRQKAEQMILDYGRIRIILSDICPSGRQPMIILFLWRRWAAASRW